MVKEAVVYPNSTVYLGRQMAKLGFLGKVLVLYMPDAVVIARPGVTAGEFNTSIHQAAAEFYAVSREKGMDNMPGDVGAKEMASEALSVLSHRIGQVLKDCEVLRKRVEGREKDMEIESRKIDGAEGRDKEREVRKMLGLDGSEKVEHGIEVDTEPEHEHETGAV